MDLMSLIGWVLAAILMVVGMVLNNNPATYGADGAKLTEQFYEINWAQIMSFFDPTSVAIVIGGTIAALMIAFPGKFFMQVPKHLKIVVFPTKYNPITYIDQLVEFAKEARISGLLALESKLQEVEDEFLKSSLLMVVDAVDAEKVKQLLDAKMEYLDDRHSQAVGFYEKGANFAPAFGMIGTLIGLVNLLGSLDDPSAIGPAMAVALITTFYGTVMANIIFNPIATKLKARHEEEFLCKMIICEGVQAIQAGDNPKFIREKLLQLIPNNMAIAQGDGEGGEADGGKKGKKPQKVKREKK